MRNNKYETPEIVVSRFDVTTRTMADAIDGNINIEGDGDISIPEVTTLPDLPHLGGGL